MHVHERVIRIFSYFSSTICSTIMFDGDSSWNPLGLWCRRPTAANPDHRDTSTQITTSSPDRTTHTSVILVSLPIPNQSSGTLLPIVST